MLKLLIGGSPCTHWSIAQTKHRETEPSGIGWELFQNFLIAREKYRPDYFLYENNKSMAPAIRAQITRELGVEPILINSALLSAQSRQRLYWTNIPGVEQPEDRGLLLRDVLDGGSDLTSNAKSYALTATYDGAVAWNTIERHQRNMVAVPVRIGLFPNRAGEAKNNQSKRIYSPEGKFVALCTSNDEKVAQPVQFATGAAWRGREGGSAFEVRGDKKSNAVITGHQSRFVVEWWDGKTYPAYEVQDGLITIKDKTYPIKLADGYYIIRKLTVLECMRLQTVPEWYAFPVSDTQAYKMLGNGWTVDVVAHILSYAPGIDAEPVEVLSMYGGMSCGHIALDKLGAAVSCYYAMEIDKYAIQTTQHNYPDTVQLGDAFQVREDGWRPERKKSI